MLSRELVASLCREVAALCKCDAACRRTEKIDGGKGTLIDVAIIDTKPAVGVYYAWYEDGKAVIVHGKGDIRTADGAVMSHRAQETQQLT
jgi:hypothetical protein